MIFLWFCCLFCVFTFTWLIMEIIEQALDHMDELAKYKRDVEEIW